MTVAYNKDPSPVKLNLGVGAYRTEVIFFFSFFSFTERLDFSFLGFLKIESFMHFWKQEGKPLVLNVVRKAEQMLVNDRTRVKEYLPIVGLADFNKLSAKLILGADRFVNWMDMLLNFALVFIV